VVAEENPLCLEPPKSPVSMAGLLPLICQIPSQQIRIRASDSTGAKGRLSIVVQRDGTVQNSVGVAPRA
jgi:hypothetical protein